MSQHRDSLLGATETIPEHAQIERPPDPRRGLPIDEQQIKMVDDTVGESHGEQVYTQRRARAGGDGGWTGEHHDGIGSEVVG